MKQQGKNSLVYNDRSGYVVARIKGVKFENAELRITDLETLTFAFCFRGKTTPVGGISGLGDFLKKALVGRILNKDIDPEMINIEVGDQLVPYTSLKATP
jgi:hypothetical protein